MRKSATLFLWAYPNNRHTNKNKFKTKTDGPMGYNWPRLLWVNSIDVRLVVILGKNFRMFVDAINVVTFIAIVAETQLVLVVVLLI